MASQSKTFDFACGKFLTLTGERYVMKKKTYVKDFTMALCWQPFCANIYACISNMYGREYILFKKSLEKISGSHLVQPSSLRESTATDWARVLSIIGNTCISEWNSAFILWEIPTFKKSFVFPKLYFYSFVYRTKINLKSQFWTSDWIFSLC